jgi:hypothetical protein
MVDVVPLVVEVRLAMLMLRKFWKRVVVGCSSAIESCRTFCVEAVLQTTCIASWVGSPSDHFSTSLDLAGIFSDSKMLV